MWRYWRYVYQLIVEESKGSSGHIMKEDHVDEQIPCLITKNYLSNFMVTQSVNPDNGRDDFLGSTIIEYFL